MSKLGIIAALPAEAACLYDKKLELLAPIEIHNNIFLCLSGMGHDAANAAAKKLLDYKINGLISWGVAGALDPALDCGDLVIAESITDQINPYTTSPKWQSNVKENIQLSNNKIFTGTIASSKNICATIDDKKNLFKKTNAIAVDMESTAIAEIALNNKLDFLVIRAIADTADTTVPEAVQNHTDNIGNPEIFKFMTSCISKPKQIKEITVLAKSYKKALKTLSDIAPELKKLNFFYS